MAENQQIVIKKYPNRRLYNMDSSSYITLEELSNFVKKDIDFKVIDAKTSDDITRVVLTQIILDHELKGYNLVPVDFLKLVIKFYDHQMSQIFNDYLSTSIKCFTRNQNYAKNLFNDEIISLTNKLTQYNMNFFKDLFKSNEENNNN